MTDARWVVRIVWTNMQCCRTFQRETNPLTKAQAEAYKESAAGNRKHAGAKITIRKLRRRKKKK